jgi:two-component system, NarL family, response regulator NreC
MTMTPETTPNGPASSGTSGSRPDNPPPIDDRLDPATTIILADDHRLVRSALRTVIEIEGGTEVVAEAGDVGETLRKVRGHTPDVLVLDLNMPGGSGLDAIPRILEASPGTAIVVLTMEDEPQVAQAALRSGARAFVPKDAADTELIDAIRAAADGHDYLSPELGARIAVEPPPESGAPDGLTERQLEVLRLLVSGYTNSEIADQLGIGERTVESHRTHIQQKTHRKSRADLVAYTRDHGLVDR